MDEVRLITLGKAEPNVEGAWVAPSATLVGAVTLGPESSVWYGTVLRADHDRITIGAGSNVQDGCVMHADPGLPVTVGDRVTVGHRAVLHGCTVEDDSLIGMGAMVLNGARIGAGSLVAAGSVVLEGTEVPPGSLVAGLPGKVRRPLSAEEREGLTRNAEEYVELAARHRQSTD
jgi:carbonic anhydrase/acetyltransferase-like protein (isoleucine patch superfamily)